MRHMLMDPAFPDIVAEWAASEPQPQLRDCANDNAEDVAGDSADSASTADAGKREIAATRLW